MNPSRVALAAALLLALGGCAQAVRLPAAEAQALSARRAVVFAGADSVELTAQGQVLDYRLVVAGGGRAGIGTAFPVSSDGLLMTAAHVVDHRIGVICVWLPGDGSAPGRFVPAARLHAETADDLAVLKVGVPTPRAFELAAAPPALGSAVVSSGTTEGSQRGPFYGMTAGAEGRPRLEFGRDGEVGDSGGPLLDDQGRVIGVLTGAAIGWRRGPRAWGVATGVDAAWWADLAPRLAAVEVPLSAPECRLAGTGEAR